MRIRKIMRGAFYTNGLQTSFEAGNLTPTSIDTDWYIYYTDENSDDWKIAPTGTTNATTSPILVDSTTTALTINPLVLIAMSGTTVQMTVVNQDSVNVITECFFASSDEAVAIVNTTGLITIYDTGTTTITTSHEDEVSGTTAVTGYYNGPLTLTPSVNNTPADIVSGITGTTLQFVLTADNNGDAVVTNDASWYSSTLAGPASTGVTISATGLATISADADPGTVVDIHANYPENRTHGTGYEPETTLTVVPPDL